MTVCISRSQTIHGLPTALIAGVDVEAHTHAMSVAVVLRDLAFAIGEMVAEAL